MPALDVCHEQVVHALENAGWKVQPMPYVIRVPGRRNPLYADIRAQRDQNHIIVVEIKCFQSNPLEELYSALGQYLVYRNLIRQIQIDYPVYLAVPSQAYYSIFKEIGIGIVSEINVKLIVIDLENEVIEQWLE